jgi:hypothetical protein
MLTAGLVAGWSSFQVFAQGTIYLNNRTPEGDVRINLGETGTNGTTAQLFLVPTSGYELIPLYPSTTLRTGVAASFVYPEVVSVPNIPAGAQVTVILRAWINGNDLPGLRWESIPLTVTLGGTNETGEVFPAAPLSGLQGGQPLTPTISWFQSITLTNNLLRFGVWNASVLSHAVRVESSSDLTNWQPAAPTWEVETLNRSFVLPFTGTSGEEVFYRMWLDLSP